MRRMRAQTRALPTHHLAQEDAAYGRWSLFHRVRAPFETRAADEVPVSVRDAVHSQAAVLQYVRQSAENGDDAALLSLAQLYYLGTPHVPPDYAVAYQLLRRAYTQARDPELVAAAAAWLGDMHYRDRVPKQAAPPDEMADSVHQHGILDRAVHRLASLVRRSLRSWRRSSPSTTVPLHSPSTAEPSPQPQQQEEKETGVEMAYKYWKEALRQQENPVAATGLGMMYRDGVHVPKNLERANHYLHRAVREGYAEAHFNLGLLHLCMWSASSRCAHPWKWRRPTTRRPTSTSPRLHSTATSLLSTTPRSCTYMAWACRLHVPRPSRYEHLDVLCV